MVYFQNREEGGQQLAALLKAFEQKPDVVVLGLARGGVATARAVADVLQVPLDVLVVRKLGAPGQEELAIGAVGEENVLVLNNDLIASMGIGKNYIDHEVTAKQEEVKERVKIYREHYPAIDLDNKTAILVDDGVATGATMEAAIKVAYAHKAKKIIVAAPVIASDVIKRLKQLADHVIFLDNPDNMMGIGQFYFDFKQLNHDDVIDLLTR